MTIEKLQSEHERARRHFEETQAKIEAARAEQARQQAERMAEHDRQTLAGYDAQDWNRRIRLAEQNLRNVIAGSDIGRAAAELYAERVARADAASEVAASRSRLGMPADPNVPPVADLDLVDLMGRVVMNAGEDLAENRRGKAEAELQAKLRGGTDT